MGNLLMIAIGALVLLTMVVLLWVERQVARLRQKPEASAKTELEKYLRINQLNGWIFLIALLGGGVLIIWSSLAASKHFLPEPASQHGIGVDRSFWWTMGITGFTFVLTQVLLFYFAFRYRHTSERQAHFYPNNNKLELLWTAVPTITFIVLFFVGLDAWEKITSKAPDDAVVVSVMGQQFSWMVRYPGPDGQLGRYDYRQIDAENDSGLDLTDQASFDDFTPNQIHIPKGKTIQFKLIARDVIHDAYLPHFRMKMDAVPGMTTSYHFVARFTTQEMREKLNNPDFNYELACAELCGRGHFVMRYIVVVEEEKNFEKWCRSQHSWLSQHPDYLTRVPDRLKQIAQKQIHLAKEAAVQPVVTPVKLSIHP